MARNVALCGPLEQNEFVRNVIELNERRGSCLTHSGFGELALVKCAVN